ncbi:hypothetical protein [Lewinella sp. JB7]|uniref:hypothetical protein n=1 Tax=Lewinella sp. JB7 TaxID=2962887 RepID=UPI0020C9C57A|nr:hypothetical protein [Lewinella sp. JB7]MCP9237165.1 hypothetical protein [Lewinella sp. JB7]
MAKLTASITRSEVHSSYDISLSDPQVVRIQQGVPSRPQDEKDNVAFTIRAGEHTIDVALEMDQAKSLYEGLALIFAK